MFSNALDHIRVGDAMHAGVVSCPGDTPLAGIARLMAEHRIHAVLVTDGDSKQPIGLASDHDVLRATVCGEEVNAARMAGTERLLISSEESLLGAVLLMAEHELSHLVVVDSATGRPVGILSSIDVASVIAGREPRARD
jgi:CBS domain-containing protein